jgi:hypothetical protein
MRNLFSDLTPKQLLMLRNLGFDPFSSNAVTAGTQNSPVQVNVEGLSDKDKTALMGRFALPIELTQGLTATPTAQMMTRQNGGVTGVDVTPGLTIEGRNAPVSFNVARQIGSDGRNTDMYGAGLKLGDGEIFYTRAQPSQGQASNTYGYGGQITPDVSGFGSVTTGGRGGTRYQAGVDVRNLLQGLFSAGVELTPEQKDYAFYGRYSRKF